MINDDIQQLRVKARCLRLELPQSVADDVIPELFEVFAEVERLRGEVERLRRLCEETIQDLDGIRYASCRTSNAERLASMCNPILANLRANLALVPPSAPAASELSSVTGTVVIGGGYTIEEAKAEVEAKLEARRNAKPADLPQRPAMLLAKITDLKQPWHWLYRDEACGRWSGMSLAFEIETWNIEDVNREWSDESVLAMYDAELAAARVHEEPRP